MRSNLQRLGQTLDGRMKQTSGAASKIALEFGVISDNLYLTVDSIGTPIPKGDYMVSLSLTHNDDKGYTPQYGGAEIEPHTHRVPSAFRVIQPGDRVLVAWVGHEPVVIDIIASSNTITSN